MGRFVRGDVVVTPFPFSDLTGAKRRPALVVAALAGDDVVLCQITSHNVRDDYAIHLEDEDFWEGGLRQPSNIRPNRIFTADSRLVLYGAGKIAPRKAQEVVSRIISILTT